MCKFSVFLPLYSTNNKLKIIVYWIYKIVSFLLVSLFDIFVKAVWDNEEM